jgi:signal transduction histidine kinase
MHLLVESTLDLLRGVGRAEPESEQDLCGVLSELQTEFDELGWNVTSSCGRGAVVQCRRLAVKRCLRNLIENAVKYGVQARVTAELQDDEVVVLIADKGPGIPEDQLDAVFQPFYRLEHSRSRETGGLGLGLSIAREIAQFHRATLTLRNAPGGGAICELRFPSSLMQAENTA